MSDTVIRLVTGEERLSTSHPLTRYAFQPSPTADDLDAVRRRIDTGRRRVHVLFDGDEPRAAAAAIEMTQNVRGRLLPMGGVAGVASHPATRRRGHARRLLTHVVADMRAQGQVVSALYPFRASFYQKFGYIGIGPERRASLPPADLAPLLRLNLPGDLTLHPYPEVAGQVRALTEAAQRDTHGMALRADPGLAEARLADDQWAVLATLDGEPAGYLSYRITGYGGELTVSRWSYRNPAVRALLLSWLARHTDQVATVSLPLNATERPATWVPDAALRVESQMSPMHAPAPMARILSVPGLAGITVGDGEITVALDDELIGGRYTLHGADGTLSVVESPTTEPTAELTGHGLAGMVYGVLDPAELPLRGFGAVSPTAADSLRALFPLDPPYLLESF